MKFDVVQVLLVWMRSIWRKNIVVLSPNNESWWLMLPKVILAITLIS